MFMFIYIYVTENLKMYSMRMSLSVLYCRQFVVPVFYKLQTVKKGKYVTIVVADTGAAVVRKQNSYDV